MKTHLILKTCVLTDLVFLSAPAYATVLIHHWTGDLHSFAQRFSVQMIGNAFMAGSRR